MAFHRKIQQLKETLPSEYGLNRPTNNISNLNRKNNFQISKVKSTSKYQVKVTSHNNNSHENYVIERPIIIQKKSKVNKSYSTCQLSDRKNSSVKKSVEPFVPLSIPIRDRKQVKQQLATAQTTCRNKQIQIFIQKDKSKEKDCLKKLFKKIHKLTQDLAKSEAERVRLNLQVQHLKKMNKGCNQHQKLINKLEGDKYKLEKQVQLLNKQLKSQNRKMPKQTVKEIIVQKPVEVRVQIPKYIPGPERIIQKIVQVEKKIPIQKVVPQIVEKIVYVDKPVYLDKPVYVDKPIYVDNPVQRIVEKKVQIPIQIPYQVPIYIDRPVIDQQWMRKLQQLEDELGEMMRVNHHLKSDNHQLLLDNQNLRQTVGQLNLNMEVLQRHNQEKNRQIEHLLRNGQDYKPTRNQFLATRQNSFTGRRDIYDNYGPVKISQRKRQMY